MARLSHERSYDDARRRALPPAGDRLHIGSDRRRLEAGGRFGRAVAAWNARIPAAGRPVTRSGCHFDLPHRGWRRRGRRSPRGSPGHPRGAGAPVNRACRSPVLVAAKALLGAIARGPERASLRPPPVGPLMDVRRWLESLDLGQHAEAFEANDSAVKARPGAQRRVPQSRRGQLAGPSNEAPAGDPRPREPQVRERQRMIWTFSAPPGTVRFQNADQARTASRANRDGAALAEGAGHARRGAGAVVRGGQGARPWSGGSDATLRAHEDVSHHHHEGHGGATQR